MKISLLLLLILGSFISYAYLVFGTSILFLVLFTVLVTMIVRPHVLSHKELLTKSRFDQLLCILQSALLLSWLAIFQMHSPFGASLLFFVFGISVATQYLLLFFYGIEKPIPVQEV